MTNINLNLQPLPGSSYGVFNLGDSFTSLCNLIGVDSHEFKDDYFYIGGGWEYFKRYVSFGSYFYDSLIYRDTAIELDFYNGILKDIILGYGWKGDFYGVSIGDELPEFINGFEVVFNDQQDEFVLSGSSGYVNGVSLGTNARAPLSAVKNQIIQKVRIFS